MTRSMGQSVGCSILQPVELLLAATAGSGHEGVSECMYAMLALNATQAKNSVVNHCYSNPSILTLEAGIAVAVVRQAALSMHVVYAPSCANPTAHTPGRMEPHTDRQTSFLRNAVCSRPRGHALHA